ncbi:MAG TPA: formate hydrogenlyase maturation protein HycH [Syntrophomonadaceae bacterium]|nr:formate hydrogenlyase maturation protein HycH [Syntrophomonadaceae bacterium]
MTAEIQFYQLSRKFVDSKDTPGRSKNLIYYTQAIGHHIGVLDCLTPVFKINATAYQSLLAKIPEGEARRKLEGVLKWGEIEITKEHVSVLLDALSWVLKSLPHREQKWTAKLTRLLRLMEQDPVIYLVVRRI